MKKKKSIIDTYETIYNVDLVVANKHVTTEELRKLYVYSDDTEIEDDNPGTFATVSTCYRKSDDKSVALVRLHDYKPKYIDKFHWIDTISHEAGHVALDIYSHMGQQVHNSSSEPFCYLLGWVTKCIYKTFQKK